jgi:hypothetical protein
VTQELSGLETDIEQTRDRLANTIDELIYRTSPKTILNRQVASAKAHFVDPQTGAPRTGNILKVVGGVVAVVAVVGVIRAIVR